MDDEITRLERALAGLTGNARALTLMQLGQARWTLYWRTGIGAQVGLPHLDATITALDEALDYLEPGDTLRVHTVAMLGVARCTRHSAHQGPVADREAGIPLLEEALAARSGNLATATTGLSRATLGGAYLQRSMEILRSPDDLMGAMTRGAPAHTIADMEQAIGHLRQVTGANTAPQLAQTAGKMLRMAETMHTVLTAFGSPRLSSQLDVVMRSLAEMQEIVQDYETNGFGLGSHVTNMSFTDFEWTQHADPTDYPGAMLREEEQPEPERPERQKRPEQQEPPERQEHVHFGAGVDDMRGELRALIGADGHGDDGDGAGSDVFAVATDLLRAAEPPAWIDEFVASAARVVHSTEPPSGADHFLLAVALHLRSRRDGDDGGWGEDADATPDGDAQAAVASLLAAAETVLDEEPDAVPALIGLAQASPDGALESLGSRLGGLTALLQSVGAEAVELPEPADSLRWNAAESCFEPVGEPCGVRTLVVVDGGGSVREFRPSTSASEDDVTVSYVASLSQLRTLSRRKVRPVAEKPVFVANPRGDRMPAAVETMLLRRSFYPRSVGLGGLIEAADGAGTAEEVRARLDASVLHLACGVTKAGALELADASELDLTDVEAKGGGVAVLPPGHFQPLADILLTAGFTSVIGWRRPVPEAFAAAAYFLLHTELADVGRAPGAAVRAVRKQLREPDAASLPPLLAARFEAMADAAGDEWTALVCRGR